MNNTTKLLRVGLLAALLSGFVLPVTSDAKPVNAKPRISIELGGGPPALRIETHGRPPSPRHVWVDGHWDWSRRRNDWVWREGGWKVPPRGRGRWVAPTYNRRDDRWEVIKGRWERGDDDRDGRGRGRDHDGHPHN